MVGVGPFAVVASGPSSLGDVDREGDRVRRPGGGRRPGVRGGSNGQGRSRGLTEGHWGEPAARIGRRARPGIITSHNMYSGNSSGGSGFPAALGRPLGPPGAVPGPGDAPRHPGDGLGYILSTLSGGWPTGATGPRARVHVTDALRATADDLAGESRGRSTPSNHRGIRSRNRGCPHAGHPAGRSVAGIRDRRPGSRLVGRGLPASRPTVL